MGREGSLQAEVLANAARAWPGVSVEARRFERWLQERASPDALDEHAVDELYLCCACASGDTRALELFESHYVSELDVALARYGAAVADEAKQLVRLRLFGPDNAVAEFRGRGDLRNWLKVMAVRVALGLLRREKAETPLDDEGLGAVGQDAELEYFQRHYTHELKLALEAAVAALEVRERNVLRQHLVDRLNIDEIGALYRVNRVTAYRWVTAARERWVALTRQRLLEQLKLSPIELESLVRAIDSRVDLSLRRLLKPSR